MICAIAVATGTHPDQWMNTPDDILVTVIDILERNAERT